MNKNGADMERYGKKVRSLSPLSEKQARLS